MNSRENTVICIQNTAQVTAGYLMMGMVSGVAMQRSNSTQPPCQRGVSARPLHMSRKAGLNHVYFGHEVF